MQQPRDFSLYGAVDLGARQAAIKRREAAAAQASRSAAGPEGTVADGAVGAVVDVTEETFGAEVLERSMSIPVVIDLWAEWCGPCKQLSPILEKLAAEANGRWLLAKIDTEANQQLSAALRVQSIPMVLVAIGGQIVPGFVGAMPESQVRQWLDQVLAEAERLGFTGPAEPAGAASADGAAPGQQQARARARPGAGQPMAADEPEIAEAQQAMERGDLEGAEAAFKKLKATSPGHPMATIGLAQVGLIRRVSSYDQARVRKEAAERPADVEAQCRVADIDLATGRIDDSFDRLIGTVRRTVGEDRDRARVHLLGLFDVLPPRDPRVAKARAILSSLLF